MSVSDYITAGVLLTSPLWLYCGLWYATSRAHVKEKMKKGLSFKESVKQVFKESLVNGSGDGSFQHNHSAFDCDEHYNSSMNSSSICDTEEPWWSDPSRRSEPGNIYHNS